MYDVYFLTQNFQKFEQLSKMKNNFIYFFKYRFDKKVVLLNQCD